jgi:hypothetical protein
MSQYIYIYTYEYITWCKWLVIYIDDHSCLDCRIHYQQHQSRAKLCRIWGSHSGGYEATCLLDGLLYYSSTLKMEAIRSSETSGETQRTTRRYIPEDDTLQGLSCWPFPTLDGSVPLFSRSIPANYFSIVNSDIFKRQSIRFVRCNFIHPFTSNALNSFLMQIFHVCSRRAYVAIFILNSSSEVRKGIGLLCCLLIAMV